MLPNLRKPRKSSDPHSCVVGGAVAAASGSGCSPSANGPHQPNSCEGSWYLESAAAHACGDVGRHGANTVRLEASSCARILATTSGCAAATSTCSVSSEKSSNKQPVAKPQSWMSVFESTCFADVAFGYSSPCHILFVMPPTSHFHSLPSLASMNP